MNASNLALLETSIAKTNTRTCQHCNLKNICITQGVSSDQIPHIEGLITQNKIVPAGSYIFEEQKPFTSLYAVRTGAIKAFTITEDGREQVTGFHLPGEIIALDSANTSIYTSSAVALESSSVCNIPFGKFEELALKIPTLQHFFFSILSEEIKNSRRLVLLGKRSSDQKLAYFLLNLSMRLKVRHLSSVDFHLPMSRVDIGNYLGLAVETVSRTFMTFHRNNIINLDGRNVTITDMDALKKVIAGDEH